VSVTFEEVSRRAAALPSGWQRDAAERLLAYAEGYLLSAETVCRQAEQLATVTRFLDDPDGEETP
jgi:hypothetical protein